MLLKALGVVERAWNAHADGVSETDFERFYGIVVAREMPVWEQKGYAFKKK